MNTAQSGSETTDSPLIGITLNRLAREQMKFRLLADIKIDLVVCELEGIPRNEYLQELTDLLSEFLPGVSGKQINEERRTGCTF